MTATRSGEGPAEDRRRLAGFGGPLLGLLGIEFLLGMALALFTTLPSSSLPQLLASSPLLDVHLIVAALLIGFASNILRVSIRSGERGAVGFAALGLVSAVVAVGAGLSFVFGGQSPLASFAMSVGFVGMVVEAGYLLRLPALRSTAPGDASPRRGGAGAREAP
jgi:hypothetical protein